MTTFHYKETICCDVGVTSRYTECSELLIALVCINIFFYHQKSLIFQNT